MKKKIFTYLILLFFVSNVFAQKKQIYFEKLSLKDGLSQSTVNCINQDSKGFMWFGTLDGLNKYNGYEITVFRNNLTDSSSIADNTITSIFEDSKGFLWIGTLSKGLAIYDKLKNNFTSIQKTTNNALIDNHITSIVEDMNGNIWIATHSGLSKIVRGENGFEFTNFTEKTGLLSNQINFLLTDKTGNIWIASNKGLSSYNVNKQEFTKHTIKNSASNTNINVNINTLCLNKQNFLWLGTDNGLVKYYKSSQIAIKLEQAEQTKNKLNDNKITNLLVDKAGDLWIGTVKNGLFKFIEETGELFNFKHEYNNNSSISANEITNIFQDNSGILWIGTSLGGINKWNKFIDNIKVYKHNSYDHNSISSNLIRTIYQDKKGTIWIGTVDGGLNKWEQESGKFIAYKYNYLDENSISSNNVRAIFEDNKGRFWIGTDGGGLNLFDRKTEKFKRFKKNNKHNNLNSDRIWGISEEGENLLIATFGGGINIFNYEKKQFRFLKNDSTQSNSLSDNRVTCIYKDSKKKYWVGTYGGGLNLFQSETNTFQVYRFNENNENSLGNDRVYSILEDSNNDLWIGTKGSLNKFDSISNSFTRYTENDNLPNDVIIGILEDNDKNLWISTNKGIGKFNIETNSVQNYDVNDGLQSNEFLVGSYCKSTNGEMYFGGINGFNAFLPSKMNSNTNIPKIVITAFKVLNEEIVLDSAISEKKHLRLNWKSNDISFEFVALDYIFSKNNEYAYKLEGFEKKWNYIKNRRFASYTNLPKGKYIFRVKGSNNDGLWNEEGTKIHITIAPALWQSLWFQILLLIIVSLVLVSFVKYRLKVIKNQENELERLVTIRTKEVFQQKKKIKEQLQQIAFQKQEITDSLMYAKSLQIDSTNSESLGKKAMKDYFIYTKAKYKINHNFYWIKRKGNKIIIAILDNNSDSTVKILTNKIASSFLNNYLNKEILDNPGKILSKLVRKIHGSLKDRAVNIENITKIEVAICILDLDNNRLQYSGANTPLYLIRNKKLSITESYNKALCFKENIHELDFETQKINILPGDIYYLFTDGYAEQIGGNENLPFMYRRFRDLLLNIHTVSMDNQKKALDKRLKSWIKKNKLSDDVLIIGFSV